MEGISRLKLNKYAIPYSQKSTYYKTINTWDQSLESRTIKANYCGIFGVDT